MRPLALLRPMTSRHDSGMAERGRDLWKELASAARERDALSRAVSAAASRGPDGRTVGRVRRHRAVVAMILGRQSPAV